MTVLSALYGAMLLSSMLLPPLLIRLLGCKWTIVVSMSCYVAFSLGNFYASWYAPPCAARAPGAWGQPTAAGTGSHDPGDCPLRLLNGLGLPKGSLGVLSPCPASRADLS